MTKFTPGPWALERRKDGGYNLIGDGKTLCVNLNLYLTNAPDFIDGHANAKLISKAPELYEMLARLVRTPGLSLNSVVDEALALLYKIENGKD